MPPSQSEHNPHADHPRRTTFYRDERSGMPGIKSWFRPLEALAYAMRGDATISSRAGSGRSRLLLAAAPLVLPVSAWAQDAGTWSLPPSSTGPTQQGPVDAQNPVVRPSDAPRPTPTPSPSPSSPAPTIVASPPPPPQATTSRPAPRATVAPDAASPAPAPAPAPSSEAPPSQAVPETPNVAPVAEPTTPAAPAPAPAVATDNGISPWWAALPLVLLALGAFAWNRRRRDAAHEAAEWDEPEIAEELAVAPDAAPVPPPAPIPVASVVPSPRFAPPPAPPPAVATDEVDFAFEPLALRLSLVYATLRYRLAITASADRAGAPLLGDMISAHATLSQAEQLAPPVEALAPLREVPPLRAGETQVLTGELMLPLGAIRPLRRGNASFLVPLVRLCLPGAAGEEGLRRVFTVGQPTGAALAPLRTDTGPQTYDGLAAREVEAARGFPVEPTIAQRVAV